MRPIDFFVLTPFILLSVAPIIIMLTIAFKRNHAVIACFSAIMFVITFLSLFYVKVRIPYWIDPLFVIDGFSVFFIGLIAISGFFLTLITYQYSEKHDEAKEEFYILLFLTALGSSVMVCAEHFVSFFLGLEILSVAAYVLIAYVRKRDWSTEAAIKYLVMASVSSAILLFGMGLVYAGTGAMMIIEIRNFLNEHGSNVITMAGFVMIFAGIGFKLALVPFHMWTPDVYQGAPAPVSAMLATVSKGGVFVFFLRSFLFIYIYRFAGILISLTVISIVTMLMGNLLALRQNNVKRILAYSSIAHMGYLLVAIVVGQQAGAGAAMMYLAFYVITSLGTFGVISAISGTEREAELISDFRGLFWKRPALAIFFTVMLLSLAGMPLTVGFIGKFLLLNAGANAEKWVLVIFLVITSIISLYYYLKIVVALFSKSEQESTGSLSLPVLVYSIFGCITLVILWLGIAPSALLNLIGDLMRKM